MAFRDDHEALLARVSALEQEVAEKKRLEKRVEQLEEDNSALDRDYQRARRQLDRIHADRAKRGAPLTGQMGAARKPFFALAGVGVALLVATVVAGAFFLVEEKAESTGSAADGDGTLPSVDDAATVVPEHLSECWADCVQLAERGELLRGMTVEQCAARLCQDGGQLDAQQ